MASYTALRSREQNGKTTQGADSAGDDEAHYKQELLVAVQTGDEDKLRHAIEAFPKAVNHVFPHPVSATVLHVATLNNSLELVKILLKEQADVAARDLRGKRYCPIHYAAQNGNVKILEELLNAGADPNAKEGEFGRTCLHILAVKWKGKEDAYRECLDLLLSRDKIRVEALDSSKVSPLFLAATKGWRYMVEKLIYKGANVDAAVGNKTARTIIADKFPDLLDSIDFTTIQKAKRCFSDELYDALKDSDLELFQEILGEIDATDEKGKSAALEEDHGEYTLLEYACDNGEAEFVEELLKNGANPSQPDKINSMSPILYAARIGFHKILEMLLRSVRQHKELEKRVLKHKDLRKETALHKVVKREYQVDREGVDYYKCLELLLERRPYVDLDAQDKFGNTALHYAVLCDDQNFVRILLLNGANLGIKNCFDTLAITRIQPSVLREVLNECIKYKHNVAHREFEIILHYSMLVPSQTSQQPETECLRFLSDSRKHRHLLLHPIIDTFLFLKWQRIQKYYYFNIIAYTIFLILLTMYILLYHGSFVPLTAAETEVDSEALPDQEEPKEMPMYNLAGMIVLKALITIFVLYIAVREGVQLSVSWKLYVQRLENWLEISIVCLTFTLLFIPMDATHQQSLCAWLVLFSWVEFMLLLGGHPYLSIYITMFTTVSKNFLKFIVMFSFMIVAFSISFFLVFQVNENFSTYYQSLLKTLAMTTGEIEYTDLPLSAFSVSSHLLFVVFVFLIVLVLMNLLNGLAVSDIQQIRQEAELVSYRSRVELVSYIESVFLASPFHHILPRSLRCCEGGDEKDDCSNVTSSMDSYNPAIMLLNWLGRHTLMFQTCLRDPSIHMFPNRGENRWYVCDCHSFKLKEAQIEAAKDVVLEKEYAIDNHRLSGLENRLEELMGAVSSLTDKVNKHVLCPSPQ